MARPGAIRKAVIIGLGPIVICQGCESYDADIRVCKAPPRLRYETMPATPIRRPS